MQEKSIVPNDGIIKIYEPTSSCFLLLDITLFTSLIKNFFEATDRKSKKNRIQQLLNSHKWFEHYYDKKTGRKVLSESGIIEYVHELETAIKLTKANYDVIFTPKGFFNRTEKKFDIFILRDHILLKADLKEIFSINPLTIAKRIKEGCDQAPRVVLDIKSDIHKLDLIDGL